MLLYCVDTVVQIYFSQLPNFQVTPTMRENYVWHAELMKESWEAETSTENRETVDPLVVSLEEAGESHLDIHCEY
jgi:hypothetical protein